ncbi:hypothetical protein PoB_005180600 [Plakobranchus ocellatus]|uniref:Uncharacterized protein n=1 Tax=Plakobranchus ocellatus TaxID=259542 RepID=A0AAV4BPY0_9GAST|nr:hypothetical protein PoB_005180600 [Plakobranchus ocellatus]
MGVHETCLPLARTRSARPPSKTVHYQLWNSSLIFSVIMNWSWNCTLRTSPIPLSPHSCLPTHPKRCLAASTHRIIRKLAYADLCLWVSPIRGESQYRPAEPICGILAESTNTFILSRHLEISRPKTSGAGSTVYT